MNDAQTFSERMRTCRIELGMSQRDLSREASISPPQLSRYESGLATPRADIASRIAKVLKVNLAWLINGVGDKNAQAAPAASAERSTRMPMIDMPPDCPCMDHSLSLSLTNRTYRKLCELAIYHGRTLADEAANLLAKVIYETHLEFANEQVVVQNNELIQKSATIATNSDLAEKLLESFLEYQTQSIERERSFKEYRELTKKHMEMYSNFVIKLDSLLKEKDKPDHQTNNNLQATKSRAARNH